MFVDAQICSEPGHTGSSEYAQYRMYVMRWINLDTILLDFGVAKTRKQLIDVESSKDIQSDLTIPMITSLEHW